MIPKPWIGKEDVRVVHLPPASYCDLQWIAIRSALLPIRLWWFAQFGIWNQPQIHSPIRGVSCFIGHCQWKVTWRGEFVRHMEHVRNVFFESSTSINLDFRKPCLILTISWCLVPGDLFSRKLQSVLEKNQDPSFWANAMVSLFLDKSPKGTDCAHIKAQSSPSHFHGEICVTEPILAKDR